MSDKTICACFLHCGFTPADESTEATLQEGGTEVSADLQTVQACITAHQDKQLSENGSHEYR